jgi:hypothetical protein
MSNVLKFPLSRIVRIVPKASQDFVLVGDAGAAVVRRLQFQLGQRRSS